MEALARKLLVDGYAAGTINRKVSILKSAYRRARKQGRITTFLEVDRLPENNVRRGFLEKCDVAGLLKHMADRRNYGIHPAVADVVTFAWLTAWRRSEVLSLTWEQIDLHAGEIRLFDSKNGHRRTVPVVGPLADLLRRRWEQRSPLCDRVFHRNGHPIKDFRAAWKTACRDSGIDGRIFHDLRRSGVRDMRRAGVPENVAMTISGHRSAQIFRRYDITGGRDTARALEATAAYRERLPETRPEAEVLPFPAASGAQK